MYEYLSRVIHDISGADYLMLSLYDERLEALRPKIVMGFEPFRETMRRRWRIDLMQMIFYLKDMRADDFSDFVSRKLLPVRDGLYGLANRKLPRPHCRAIEKLLAVANLYAMGFSWENQLYGRLTLFFKKGNELKNHAQIEALLNQAAVAIKRLLAEKSLRESERMFATLVGNLPGFVYRCRNDRNWTMEYISDGCQQITGYAPEDFIGNRKLAFNDIIQADYQDKLWNQWQEQLAGRKTFEDEYTILTAGGEVRWLWERGQGVFGDDGSLLFLEGFITDITQRRHMETALRESEKKYRLIAENTADTITVLDLDLKFTYVSHAIFKLRGYTVEEALQLTMQQTMTPDSLAMVQEVLAEEMALEAGGKADPQRSRTLELQEYCKDGSIIWVENTMSFLRDPQGKALGFLAVSKDISERKRAQTIQQIQYKIASAMVTADTLFSFFETVRKELSALLDTTNFLVALYDKASGMLSSPFEKDEKDTIPQWPAEKSLTGLVVLQKRSILLSKEQISQLAQDGVYQIIGSRAETWLGVPLQIGSRVLGAIVLQNYDKADAFDLNSVMILEMIANQLSAYIERKQADEALLISAEKWQTTFDSITDIVSVISKDHTFLEINKAGCDALGLERKDIVGKKCFELVHNLHNPVTGCPCSLTMQSKQMEVNVIFEHGRYYHLTAWPILDINGELLAFSHSVKDITESKTAEEKIKYQADLLQQVSDAIIATDKDGRIQVWNNAAEMIYGWKAQEAMGKIFHDMIKPEYLYQPREEVIEKMEQEGSWSGEIVHHFRDGRQISVHSTITMLKDAAGNRSGTVSVNHDISKRKAAEEALRMSEERLRDITFSMADWVWETDEHGVYTYSSKKGIEIFGPAQEDIIGKTPFDFMPADEARRVAAIFSEIVANKMPIKDLENWNITKNGERICLLTNGVPILDEGGNLKGYRGVDKDITERKRAEEQIRASLKEKEVLLQEIHHRVKNNLQIISGLLTLQADQSAGKSLDEIFSASQNRIRSIALIHEKLYRSHSLAEIAFDEYLRTLSENLLSSQGIAAGHITISYDMEPILFTIEKAIPLGLIVNELVTNALKHAFPDGRPGKIRIGLHGYEGAKSFDLKTDSGTLHCTPTCELTVADNGVGLPAGQVPEQQKSLGMKLVSMLAQQLQAQLKVKSGEGTEFRLIFPGLPAHEIVKDNNHGG